MWNEIKWNKENQINKNEMKLNLMEWDWIIEIKLL